MVNLIEFVVVQEVEGIEILELCDETSWLLKVKLLFIISRF
jgi:hypothetical protein